MANWLPSQVSPDANYITLLDTLALRDEDAARMAEFPTNPPVGFMRFNRSGPYFQEWIGAVWETKVLGVGGGGTGATTPAGAVTALGLGSMATQNNNAVNITGGTITGITTLSVTGTFNAGSISSSGITITAASPSITFVESDQAVNARTWYWNADGQIMQLVTAKDDLSTIGIPFFISRAGNVSIAGSLRLSSGLIKSPDDTKNVITIGNNSLDFAVDVYHFNSAAVNPILTIQNQTVAPATHPGAQLWINGGYGAPVAGKMIIGDGSGWVYHVSKKFGGVITDLFEFNDTGQHRVDWLKSLNNTYLTLEAFTAGGFQFRFFDSGSPLQAVLVNPSTFRVNTLKAWDSFTLTIESFVEGGINFNLTGAMHARLTNPSTFQIDTIKPLQAAGVLTIDSVGSAPYTIFRWQGDPRMTVYGSGTFFAKSVQFGSHRYGVLNPGVVNDFDSQLDNLIALAPTGNVEITGIAGGITGRVLFIRCDGNSLIFKHADTRSADANRFWLYGFTDVTLTLSMCAIFIYDGTISRWVLMSRNN